MNLNPLLVAPIVVCVALPLLFGLILQLVSVIGGWSALAKEYGTTERFPSPLLRMQSAEFRYSCNYSGCLTMAADAEAMYLGPMFPFGFGHPKLRLPWAQARATQTTHLFGIESTTFMFERVPNVRVRLQRKTAEKLIAIASESRGGKSNDDEEN